MSKNTCPCCGAPVRKCKKCGEVEYDPPEPTKEYVPYYPYWPWYPSATWEQSPSIRYEVTCGNSTTIVKRLVDASSIGYSGRD